jgi:hypothetical protein
VADATDISADVVELADTLGAGKLAHLLLVGSSLGRFRRNAVVEDQGDAAGVPNFGRQRRALIGFQELVDHQRRILMRHGKVDFRLNDVPGLHSRKAGSAG